MHWIRKMIDRPHSPRIDPTAFRTLEEWTTSTLLGEIRRAGEIGIEADELINVDVVRRSEAPLIEWATLTFHQRARMCWRQLDRLVRQRVVEQFYCRKHGCNPSRVRFREVNALDRMVAAL